MLAKIAYYHGCEHSFQVLMQDLVLYAQPEVQNRLDNYNL